MSAARAPIGDAEAGHAAAHDPLHDSGPKIGCNLFFADHRLEEAASDVGPPPTSVIFFAGNPAPIAAAAVIGREVRKRPSGTQEERFHVVLEGDQPLEVAEGEGPRAPAFVDDELISLVRPRAPQGQRILPAMEGPLGEQGTRDGRFVHGRRIGTRLRRTCPRRLPTAQCCTALRRKLCAPSAWRPPTDSFTCSTSPWAHRA